MLGWFGVFISIYYNLQKTLRKQLLLLNKLIVNAKISLNKKYINDSMLKRWLSN